jgi:Fe-S-cluster containining protein
MIDNYELIKNDDPLEFPSFKNEHLMTQSEICCKCTGCCRYVSVDIPSPRSKERIDLYVWYLIHKNVQIFIDHDGDWFLLFITPCTKLLPDGRCGIYETRPDICRDYSADNCSRTGKDYSHLFKRPEEFLSFLEQRKAKNKKKRKLTSI